MEFVNFHKVNKSEGIHIIIIYYKMEVYNCEARNYSKIINKTKKDLHEKGLTLGDLIDKLHDAFDVDIVDIDYVQDLMSMYRSNPQDWKKYAKFDRHR